jgi:hypothetical protein
MSEKMTSQNELSGFKSVPYSRPLGKLHYGNSRTRCQFLDQRVCDPNFLTPHPIWTVKNAPMKLQAPSFMRGATSYGTDFLHTHFFVTSFSRLFWYCHICRLLNISYLNPITNPNPLPNSTLTIGAAARNPNYQGSRVYLNYRGSRMQP